MVSAVNGKYAVSIYNIMYKVYLILYWADSSNATKKKKMFKYAKMKQPTSCTAPVVMLIISIAGVNQQ